MKTSRSPWLPVLAALAVAGLLITGCSYNPSVAPARPEPADSSESEDGKDSVG